MCVQMLHVGWLEPSLPQRSLHRATRAFAILGPGRDVKGVAGRAITDDLGDRQCPACARVLQRLDHQDAGAFSHDEAVTVSIERPRCAIWRIIEAGR